MQFSSCTKYCMNFKNDSLHFLSVLLICNVMMLILGKLASADNKNRVLYGNTSNPIIDFTNKNIIYSMQINEFKIGTLCNAPRRGGQECSVWFICL